MTTAQTAWAHARQRAATPGSTILTAWRAEREQQRSGTVRAATYSDDVLEAFGVVPAAAGVSVTATSAMRVSAVFAAVRLIAGAIASLPVHVYRRTATGRERVDDPLWWLLNEQPCAQFAAASHWERSASYQLLRGDAYTLIERSASGAPRQFIPLKWEDVTVRVEDGRIKYYIGGTLNIKRDQDDVLHFPGFGFDGEKGMSVIQWAARNAAGTAMAMDEYSGRFFAGGAHPSIVLKAPGKMSPDQIGTLQQAFISKYSGAQNAHRLPLVLTEGLAAENLSLSAEDSQLLEARKFQVIDIARAFGVPPHMIGETSASTSWGSGIEAMSRGFVTYTLQPHLIRIEQELNRKLFRTAGRFVEFNRDALLEGDSKAQAEYFRAALGGPGTGQGWMTVDDIRRLKNLPPMGGRAAGLYDPRDQADKEPTA